MKAIVLAAGKGLRLWPLTKTRPKPLLPIAGKPLLIHTLQALAKAGATEVILVLNYRAANIRESIETLGNLGVKISYTKQPSPEGTANAVLAARAKAKDEERFVVVYADNYYAPEAVSRLFDVAKREKPGITLIGAATVEDASQFGRLTVKKNLVTQITEKSQAEKGVPVITGLYLLNRSIFRGIDETDRSNRGEYELTDSLQRLIDTRKSEVRIFPFKDGEWQSISYPWDMLEANRMAMDRMKDIRAGTIEKGVHTDGKVVARKGSIVKSGSYLEGPILIDEDASVGPNAYVRPYTVIGRGAHVGANCEIKNSVLMENSKVPHLSYIGDSILGEGVSLGAGTITANLRFDGAPVSSMVRGKLVDSARRKLGAIMGDDSKTGINVSLLPGVKVGTGAWLGPGIVVGEDVQDGGRIKR